jgi:PIN domain nuclease of toxin-antitoxin system
VLIWVIDDPNRLSKIASIEVHDVSNPLHVSLVSIWEIAIKVSLGKLTLSKPYRAWVDTAIKQLNPILLPVDIAHTSAVAQLPFHHRDPFDRMLVAQAQVEDVYLVSADAALDPYTVKRL